MIQSAHDRQALRRRRRRQRAGRRTSGLPRKGASAATDADDRFDDSRHPRRTLASNGRDTSAGNEALTTVGTRAFWESARASSSSSARRRLALSPEAVAQTTQKPGALTEDSTTSVKVSHHLESVSKSVVALLAPTYGARAALCRLDPRGWADARSSSDARGGIRPARPSVVMIHETPCSYHVASGEDTSHRISAPGAPPTWATGRGSTPNNCSWAPGQAQDWGNAGQNLCSPLTEER